MTELLIRGHLGLGDHLVCNAIYRDRAAKYGEVVILCKERNAPSLAFMLRDLTNVYVFTVDGDGEADELSAFAESNGKEVLRLGSYGEKPFNAQTWDSEMFRQAGIPFQNRWNEFRVSRQPSREVKKPDGEFIFVHDDHERGFNISPSKLTPGKLVIRPGDPRKNVIFDYWDILESATEIHCIDSCFAILVDSLPLLKAKRLCIHDYARNGLPPKYQAKWERLK